MSGISLLKIFSTRLKNKNVGLRAEKPGNQPAEFRVRPPVSNLGLDRKVNAVYNSRVLFG